MEVFGGYIRRRVCRKFQKAPIFRRYKTFEGTGRNKKIEATTTRKLQVVRISEGKASGCVYYGRSKMQTKTGKGNEAESK